MPFLVIGILLFFVSSFFLIKSVREHDKEGVVGTTCLIIVAIILILIYGLFYRTILTS
ncbi:hypothetical protein ACFLZY_00900 [Patescibacteria group bacterium]